MKNTLRVAAAVFSLAIAGSSFVAPANAMMMKHHMMKDNMMMMHKKCTMMHGKRHCMMMHEHMMMHDHMMMKHHMMKKM